MTATANSTKTAPALPKGWRWVKLGEVLQRLSPTTRRLQTHEYKQTGRIAVVDQGQALITGYTDDSTVQTGVASPVIVFGDHTKIVKYIDFDFAIGADGVVLLHATNEADLRFLYYGLSQIQLPDMGYGRHYQFLGDQAIPLPPLTEQKRIAAILNEQMATVENARKAAEERLAAINALPSAYLRAIFPAPDQPLPEGWRWVKLGEVCFQDRQIVEARSTEASRLPYISLEHVESCSGRILRHPSKPLEVEGVSTTFRFSSNHVLYGKLRPYLNKVSLPDYDGRCTTEMIPLMPINEVTREFLAMLLRRNETVKHAMQGKTGSRMPRADMDQLVSLNIPLPPLTEQKRIAAILNEQMAAVALARKAAEEELATIKALPAALLRQAFAGEL